MRAFQLKDSAVTVAVSLNEVPTPDPDPGQLLIKVHAAGVIPTELLWYPTKHRENGDPRLHAIPSHEFSGTVAKIADGQAGFAAGDEVYGMNNWFWEGAAAEYCLTVPSSIAIKPKSLTHIEAATVPISALARHTIHNLQPDLEVLKDGRAQYGVNPDSLIAASQVVAIEFQTIAAANNYWRK